MSVGLEERRVATGGTVSQHRQQTVVVESAGKDETYGVYVQRDWIGKIGLTILNAFSTSSANDGEGAFLIMSTAIAIGSKMGSYFSSTLALGLSFKISFLISVT